MCLFVILLAVFTWAVHRRVAQYDSVLQDGHHLAATKVCLPDRPQITVPRAKTVHDFVAMVVAAVYAFTVVGATPSSPHRDGSDEARLAPDRWAHPGLTHFFFLPPPARIALL